MPYHTHFRMWWAHAYCQNGSDVIRTTGFEGKCKQLCNMTHQLFLNITGIYHDKQFTHYRDIS